MAIGGFSGSDRILDVSSLESLIREDKVRYFLSSGQMGGLGGSNGGNSALFSWITDHCTPVNLSINYTGENGARNVSSLYDCAGAAGTE